MIQYTVKEFQENFDELIERVENGESFEISSKYGDAVIIPYSEFKEIQCFCDHDDGC
jgi:prevent-host-death family protein